VQVALSNSVATEEPRFGAIVAIFAIDVLFKGLGHAILNNFSTDQIVIELT